MNFYFLVILFFCVNGLFAQKLPIDSAVYKQWPSLDAPTINKNGKYVFYNIQNVPIGSQTLVVQATNGSWKKEFKHGLKDGQSIFSDRYFLFINNSDSLGMLKLGTDNIKYFSNVLSFSIVETKHGEYMFYRLKNNDNKLILRNLINRKEIVFTNVDNWSFDNDMLIIVRSKHKNQSNQSVNLVDIGTGKILEIWEGRKPENLILDGKHSQLAFKVGDSIWHYKMLFAKAVCITDSSSLNTERGINLGYLDSFSKDGNYLFSSLVKKINVKIPVNGVDVWSYTDVKLQPECKMTNNDQKSLAIINIADHNVIKVQRQTGEQFQFSKDKDVSNILALVENPHVGEPWSVTYKPTWDLVTIKKGERKKMTFLDNIRAPMVQLSPYGKYIVYFDKASKNYFSYEISTAIIRNLTKNLNVSWIGTDFDDLNEGSPRGIVSLIWLKEDKSVLVYDQYDIWKLDPMDKEKPINLTNGFGKKHAIVFNYTFESFRDNILDNRNKLYLTAFNKENKNNGFFLKQLDKIGDPELLSMGPYIYQTNSAYVPWGSDFTPITTKKSGIYIVRRMSAIGAPNYFSTCDFKNFTQLSNLQPHIKYNWYSTQLHNWKSLDGTTLQGILYTPENFDPNKKYPVIFHYYERKSDGLNAFIVPESLSGSMNINIPNYVSNGYLVFCPDINYNVGDPAQGTYNAIVSAARYISDLPFVDSKKMGIQGGSFGGFQTNYLVTHTSLFAAATSSSGTTDLVSGYGGLINNERSAQNYYETGQARIGGSLWEKPESYIKNSPIFQVHKVTTPLLIMHTKNDGICLYSNTIEFFIGLRRMGKKAWMLAYEGNHGVHGKDATDFSIRMMQFFDHYLKDKPAPLWMLGGVETSNNGGIAEELKLDNMGRTPGPGLLTLSEQKKVDGLMTRKPIHITLK